MTEYHNKSCTSWAYFLITGTAGHRSITITCSTSSDMERHIHNHIGDTYKLTLEQNMPKSYLRTPIMYCLLVGRRKTKLLLAHTKTIH